MERNRDHSRVLTYELSKDIVQDLVSRVVLFDNTDREIRTNSLAWKNFQKSYALLDPVAHECWIEWERLGVTFQHRQDHTVVTLPSPKHKTFFYLTWG